MTNSSPGPSLLQARRPGPRSCFFFHHYHGSAHGQDAASRSHHRHHHLHHHSHHTSPGYVDPASCAHAADDEADSLCRSPEQQPAHAVKSTNTTLYPFTPGPESLGSGIKPRTLLDSPPKTPLAGTGLQNTAAISSSRSHLNAVTPTPSQGSDSGNYAFSAPLALPTATATTLIASPDATADFSAAADSAQSNTPWSVSDSTTVPSSPYPTIAGVHNGTNTILSSNSSHTSSSPPSSASFNTFSLSLAAISSSLPPSKNSTIFGLSVSSTLTSPSFSSDTLDTQSWSTSIVSIEADPFSTATVTDFLSSASALIILATATSSDDALAPTGPADETRPTDASGASTKTNATDTMLQKERVIGGVVGSVAGIAFLAVLVLMSLKLRKRRKDARALLGQGQLDSAPPQNMIGPGSSESSKICAVPSASSGVAHKRTAPHRAFLEDKGGQKGFYRVTGKKLPSVIFSGGDGYSDPRGSFMSEQSDHCGSTFGPDAANNTSCRLALGVPMRPVSGIPIMRLGPARTPVTENRFADPSIPPAV